MAKRPTQQKKLQRLRKALTRKSLPAYIDPVPYMVLYGLAPTKRKARELILAGKLRYESHAVGREKMTIETYVDGKPKLVEQWVVVFVPASMRGGLAVAS